MYAERLTVKYEKVAGPKLRMVAKFLWDLLLYKSYDAPKKMCEEQTSHVAKTFRPLLGKC